MNARAVPGLSFAEKKRMNITITTKKVYDYALALTARAGKPSEDYGNVALTEDNYPMLDVYLSSAVNHAEGVLRRSLSLSNGFDLKVTEDSILFSIRESTRRDPSVMYLIETGIRLFLGYYIAAEWLRPTAAGPLSELYGSTATDHLKAAIGALNQKSTSAVADHDYTQRSSEGNVRMDQTGTTLEYALRPSEGNVRMDSTSNPADYARRMKDDVQARPGTRICEQEFITLQSMEDPSIQDSAYSSTSELLISKP